eukprot:CAMPEP_0176458210 /NCGR_PEP_ID=MMETSP0127-20121128/32448_1 /TAXON_ID=938130 /ORGANISM="Platyophrya macrostoma, Strain WH" /LENGTH=700 /DNA_ID=CAMNT_0017848717 /DNA_START=94 /DNA_END=2196 /DNA_ORIENTATION=-
MGGCVISIMSSVNSYQSSPNPHIAKIRSAGVQSVEIGEVSSLPEGRIRRSNSMKDVTLEAMYDKFYGGDGMKSLVDLLKTRVDKFQDRRAIAYRPIDRLEKTEIEEGGKKKPWELIHLRPTEYMSYNQMWQKMTHFGLGLRELGFDSGSRVGLYEETRYEWLISIYGLWTQSMTGVTVYSNLGEDALEYAIEEAEVHVMVCNGKTVKNVIRVCEKAKVAVPTLIYLDALPADLDTKGYTVVSWHDVVARGAASKLAVNLPKTPDETAVIMYTSGTTGDPKGVVIAHGSVVACVKGYNRRLEHYLGGAEPEDEESYVAYLPLAHILEFAAEQVFLLRGSMVGFGSPRTLTNTSARPHGDLEEFKPSLLVGVPRIFDTIKKAVEAKLPDGFKRRVFQRAFNERLDAIHKGQETPYWNSRVFATPRQLLGGRVRAILSGGGPMSAKTQEFLMVVFGCSVGQGYGLTETCAACSIQGYWDTKTESIGGLVSTCEVKLRDVEDWKHTDPKPRGEIMIRGPIVAKGYYKQPQLTTDAFSADGWFATGDVGQVEPDGSLKIVGRVKALAKNAFGEYVALDALEAIYVLNHLALPNGVCVLVDSQKAYICALVLTDESKAMAFAKQHNIAGTWPEILKSAEFQKKAAESMAATAKAAGKKPFEMVKYVRVLNEEWTPENGVLTAAMKLKRRVIDVKYADLIKELFLPE